MPEPKLEFRKNVEVDETYLRAKQMDIQTGLLGKLFGTEKNAAFNIAGVIAVFLVITAVVATFFQTALSAAEVWKTVAPLLSVILGYIFGKKS